MKQQQLKSETLATLRQLQGSRGQAGVWVDVDKAAAEYQLSVGAKVLVLLPNDSAYWAESVEELKSGRKFIYCNH